MSDTDPTQECACCRGLRREYSERVDRAIELADFKNSVRELAKAVRAEKEGYTAEEVADQIDLLLAGYSHTYPPLRPQATRAARVK